MWVTLAAIAGLVLGSAVAWALSAARVNSRAQATRQEIENRATDLAARLDEAQRRADKVEAAAKGDFEALRDNLSRETELRVAATSDRDNALLRVAEERRLLDDARVQLKDTFEALAGNTLKTNNDQFLALATAVFGKILSDAKGDLNQRQEAFKGLVTPLSDKLQLFDAAVRELELKREGAYSGLTGQLKLLSDLQEGLRKETGNLVSALRNPQVRGRWGEVQLRRTVEMAGMSEHCTFNEQVSVQTDAGLVRPDLVVRLPDDQTILVDSKVPLEVYMQAHSAETDEEQSRALQLHASRVRDHMRILASRNYPEHFDKSPGFVVMFIPVESALSDALKIDPGIYDESLDKGVLLTTPMTLMALLKSVALTWRHDAIAKNAREISELGRELYNRMRTLATHLSKVGRGLDGALTAYNDAVGSLESRVLPAARRFQELGAATGDEITVLGRIDQTPRLIQTPELQIEQIED